MWRFSKSIGVSFLVFWLVLFLPFSIQAQSETSSPSSLQGSVSSDILSAEDLEAKVTLLLTTVSPELKPTLIEVLKDSSARQKMASAELTKQKMLWIQDQAQLTALSKKIEKERTEREIQKWEYVSAAVVITLVADVCVRAITTWK